MNKSSKDFTQALSLLRYTRFSFQNSNKLLLSRNYGIKINLSRPFRIRLRIIIVYSSVILIILSSNDEYELTNALFSSTANPIFTRAPSKLSLFASLIIWQAIKKNKSAPLDEAIKELSHILSTCLNSQELCKKDTLCFGSLSINKKSTGGKKRKTEGVQEPGSKPLSCFEESGVCN